MPKKIVAIISGHLKDNLFVLTALQGGLLKAIQVRCLFDDYPMTIRWLSDDYLMTIRWLSVIRWLSDDYPMTIQWLSNDYHKLLIYCLSPVQHSSLDDLVQKHFNCKFLRVDLYLVVFWFYSKVFSVQILRVDGSCMRGDGSDKRQQHSHTTTLLLWWSSQKWK